MEDYKNTSLPVDRRVADLVSRMTTEEKIYQTFYTAPAIPRLGVPAHNWWNEALHGVARAGIATIFPQAIGMAASFDPDLLFKVATAISDEARAKHHENARRGERGIYFGLSYWSPNVNIFRDPRWGRGQETFGEDPLLTSRLGVAFCKGLQGDDAKFYKVIATPKHFAVHSGPESLRHGFDAIASQKDLNETYLPAFKACITEAGAYSIMGAYNRTNGEACCASPTLIQKILRGDWGFEGYMVSDCGAIEDIHEQHHVTKNAAESAALAIKTGCDLNCGKVYEGLVEAVRTGLLSEEDLTTSVTRLMKARFLMGQFDPPEACKYSSISYDVVGSPAHKALSRLMARESIVLMKNDGVLPLKHRKATRYAVIGPNAYDRIALEANYYGESNEYITPLEGLRRYLGDDAIIRFAKGVERNRIEESYWGALSDRFIAEAEAVAERSDVILLFLGLSREEEGEQTGNAESDGGDDRSNLKLPGAQELLVERLSKLGKPIVLTLIAGSPMDLSRVTPNVNALVNAWYPGEQGGMAIAETLFGVNNPSGRLPVSWPVSTEDLPPFTDYSMRGRTYRYSEKPMAYPFGFGLSYTSFRYSDLRQIALDDKALTLEVKVANTGKEKGDEVVQVYRQLKGSSDGMQRQLLAFTRVNLKAGGRRTVQIAIPRNLLANVLEDGSRAAFSGAVVFSVGGHQDDEVSRSLSGYSCERLTVAF